MRGMAAKEEATLGGGCFFLLVMDGRFSGGRPRLLCGWFALDVSLLQAQVGGAGVVEFSSCVACISDSVDVIQLSLSACSRKGAGKS